MSAVRLSAAAVDFRAFRELVFSGAEWTWLADWPERLGAVQAMLSYLLNGHLTLLCVLSGVLLNLLCMYVFLRLRHGATPVIQCYLVGQGGRASFRLR